MDFWLLSGVISGLVTAGLALAVLRRRRGQAPADSDVQVYRDQLSEVDRDFARGVLSQAEAETVRLEVSHRLLDADRRDQQAEIAQSRPSPALAVALAVALFGGAFWLYGQLGSAGYRDLPLATRKAAAEEYRLTRISQAEAEARVTPRGENGADPARVELIAKLREALKTRPDDLQGFELLTSNEAGLGNFIAAHQAQRRILEIKGAEATVRDFENYTDLLALAADGYVSPEAEAVMAQVLDMNPKSGPGRYYLGLLNAQIGRPDIAFAVWDRLLEESIAGAPWVAPVRAQIRIVAANAGIRYELPELQPGPTADDVAAASEMSDAERGQFIRNMVDRLSERLASQGGPAQDWAQLIGALGVLGETERAADIWAEAQAVFAASPEALSVLRMAAGRAGLGN